MTTQNEQLDDKKIYAQAPLLSFDEISVDLEVPLRKVDSMANIDEITPLTVASRSFPLFTSSIANVGNFTVIFYFMSRTTDDPSIIGAVGLGNMTLNLFLRSYVLGFNNSLVTSLSQANGAGNYQLMGDIINRSKMLWTLLMIPIVMSLYNTEQVLAFFGQDQKLARYTEFYVTIAMYGFFMQLHYDIYRKILNSQKLFKVHAPIPYITLCLHMFWCYLLIYKLDLKLLGCALASVIQATTNAIIIHCIVHVFKVGNKPVHGFTMETFKGW